MGPKAPRRRFWFLLYTPAPKLRKCMFGWQLVCAWGNRGAVKGTAKRRPTARGVCWLAVGRSPGERPGPIGLGPLGRVCLLPIPCNQTDWLFCVFGWGWVGGILAVRSVVGSGSVEPWGNGAGSVRCPIRVIGVRCPFCLFGGRPRQGDSGNFWRLAGRFREFQRWLCAEWARNKIGRFPP